VPKTATPAASPRLLPLVLAGALAALAVGAGPPGRADLPLAELDPHFRARDGGTPAYTAAMLDLGLLVGAAKSDVLGDDPARARETLRKLREKYVAVAGLVPSWSVWFPARPLDDLDEALKAGADLPERERLMGKLERRCTVCHVEYMFPVQARYRWGSFADVAVKDAQGRKVGLHEIMLDLATTIGAIRNDVEAERLEVAERNYEHLRERFDLLERACSDCHAEPREYFIDARVKGRVLKMGTLVRKGSKATAEYDSLIADLHVESCFPCHQVHMPAAYLQEYWRLTADEE
jgi:hypothetical protein